MVGTFYNDGSIKSFNKSNEIENGRATLYQANLSQFDKNMHEIDEVYGSRNNQI